MSRIKRKILFIVFDGLADRPIPELGNKTPLEAAHKPNLDFLAAKGACGTQNALKKGEYPTSEEAHFGIFGYDYVKDLPGRGVLEGLGIGAEITPEDLVFRVDFGSVDEKLNVIDPRAGNIASVKSFCKYLGEQKIGPFTFKVYPGVGHRGALVMSGNLVSKAIRHHSTAVVSDTDPHKAKVHRGGTKVLRPYPLDNTAEARLTTDALWEYLLHTNKLLNEYVENRVRKRQGLLPANFILTRGAGFIKSAQPFRERYGLRAGCIASMPLYRGIGSYLGMDLIEAAGRPGLWDTNIHEKIEKALESFKKGYDFIFVHLKGTDVIAEELGDFEEKQKYIEEADKAFDVLRKFYGVICITGDHATPCVLKDHSTDPVPVLVVGGAPDDVKTFSEVACKKGSLGYLSGKEIMPILVSEAHDA